MNAQHNCGHCHTCGTALNRVLDGEEWCPACNSYRRYHSHGFAVAVANPNSAECPPHAPSRFRYRLTDMIVRDAFVEYERKAKATRGKYIITGIVDVRSHGLCMPYKVGDRLRLEWEERDWEAQP